MKGKYRQHCIHPSHIGIHGKTEADKVAKSAHYFEIVNFKILYPVLKYIIKLYI